MLMVALFFLVLFCAPVSAQCVGARVRAVAQKLATTVVRVSNRSRCVVRTSVSAAKCGGCAAGGLVANAGSAAIVTAAKPVKAVRQTICVGGKCYR